MENFLETIIKMLYDANWSDGCGRSAPSALVGKRGWRAVARQSGGEGAIAARRGQLTASSSALLAHGSAVLADVSSNSFRGSLIGRAGCLVPRVQRTDPSAFQLHPSLISRASCRVRTRHPARLIKLRFSGSPAESRWLPRGTRHEARLIRLSESSVREGASRCPR
jgi:hypothetical protein